MGIKKKKKKQVNELLEQSGWILEYFRKWQERDA